MTKKPVMKLDPTVEQLQEWLGTVNDHAVATARFRYWRPEFASSNRKKHYRQLIASQNQLLQEATSDFAF